MRLPWKKETPSADPEMELCDNCRGLYEPKYCVTVRHNERRVRWCRLCFAEAWYETYAQQRDREEKILERERELMRLFGYGEEE